MLDGDSYFCMMNTKVFSLHFDFGKLISFLKRVKEFKNNLISNVGFLAIGERNLVEHVRSYIMKNSMICTSD